MIISERDETGMLNGIDHVLRREAPDAVATTILRHSYYRKHIISHIVHLVPAAICVEMSKRSSPETEVTYPALALPINMPTRHTRTPPIPVCSPAERCRGHVAVTDPGDDAEFDNDHQNSVNHG